MPLFDVFRTPMLTDLGRRFIAYTLSPRLWHIPTRSQLPQDHSTTIDGYCHGLTALVESTVTMPGFEGNGNRTVPGAYPSDELCAPENNEQEVNNTCNVFEESEYNDTGNSGEMPSSGWKSGNPHSEKIDQAHPIALSISSSSLDVGSPYLLASEHIAISIEKVNHSKDEDLAIASKAENFESELPYLRPTVSFKVVDKAIHPTATLATSTPAPKPSATTKYERIRKYAGMRTLELPGRQMRPVKAPTEAELALRQIDEELAVEASKRNAYCTRELAGDGIFVHPPVSKFQPGAMLYPRTARRVRRETSVGPLNPSWSSKNSKVIPTITISKPEDLQAPKTTDKPSTSVAGKAPTKWGRARPDAVYVPSETPTTATPAPAHPEITSILVENEISTHRAARLGRNRTSMSDWLVAISAGSNSLVADHVAIKAGPVLRTSLTISPLSTPPLSPADSTSSSDSSSPSTPVDDFFLPPPLVEETKTMYASSDRRRRARCSYLGDGYEVVTAPVIPEELLTDEIGVAC